MKLAKHSSFSHNWPVETFDEKNHNVLQSHSPLVVYCYMCDKFLAGDAYWVAQYALWLQEHGESEDFAFGVRAKLFERVTFWSKRGIDLEATHVTTSGHMEVIWKSRGPRIPVSGIVIASFLVTVWLGLLVYFFHGL